MKEKELNEEYVAIIKEMRELNARRVKVFNKFQEIVPDVDLTYQHTVSIYHDLYGVDLDKVTN
jgi:uncharacterized coiled-coil DUF342 family protein